MAAEQMCSQSTRTPDIVLLGTEWPERALLRAQLIEEGYNVVAMDAWPIPEEYRRPSMKPRVMVVDLTGLPEPREISSRASCRTGIPCSGR